jgi:catechol 2,3-dioxygenase-like lactoylglutathione lyase family enzyme
LFEKNPYFFNCHDDIVFISVSYKNKKEICMPINGFAHVNVSTKDLERARKFYAEILGLKDGYRPPFSRPGAWMYLEDQPIVHISTARSPNPEPKKTDAFDHVALWTSDINHFRKILTDNTIKFVEFGVPENDQYQLFFKDPDGTEIELIFKGEEARQAANAIGAKVDASGGRNL